MIKVSIGKTVKLIKRLIEVGLVGLVVGPPAIGKSSAIQQVADDLNLKLIDLRLATLDPVDIGGLINKDENGKIVRSPMGLFPLEGDTVPEGYVGWLLLLGEITSAPLMTQAASFQLVLDRQVGESKLHSECKIICDGNGQNDGGITSRISTPMQSRLVHINTTVDHEEWDVYASKEDVDHRIRSFLQWKPDLLFKFDPNHNDCTFPAPRTWFMLSKILKDVSPIPAEMLPLLAGTIGEGAAREFNTFCKIYGTLPTMKDILANGSSLPISEDPSVLYAVTGMVAENTTKENFEDVYEYIGRLPSEFRVVAMQTIVTKTPALINHKIVNKWALSNSYLVGR